MVRFVYYKAGAVGSFSMALSGTLGAGDGTDIQIYDRTGAYITQASYVNNGGLKYFDTGGVDLFYMRVSGQTAYGQSTGGFGLAVRNVG